MLGEADNSNGKLPSYITGANTFSDVSRCQQAPSSACSRQQTYVSGSAWPLLSEFFMLASL